MVLDIVRHFFPEKEEKMSLENSETDCLSFIKYQFEAVKYNGMYIRWELEESCF